MVEQNYANYFWCGVGYLIILACLLFGIYTMGIPIVHFTGLYTVGTNHPPFAIGTTLWIIMIIVGLITGLGWFIEEVIR